jgi:hypothetical protein
MTQLEIIFVGLIALIGVGDEGRQVTVPDLSGGSEVHGHHVQEHSALLIVPDEFYLDASDNWIPTGDGKVRRFPLDGYELSVSGTQPAPFSVDASYECFVPHLTVECPEFGPLRPISQIKAISAATLDLRQGRLSACRPDKSLPAASVWTIGTTGEVTVTATREKETRWVKIKPTARIRIENEPSAAEAVGNHFIAFYDLSASGNCCTNTPFVRKQPRCPNAGGCGDVSVLTTAACSNSNYP